ELAAMGKNTGRNDALNAISYRLGRMIARGWIERGVVEAALFKACVDNGLVKEDGAKSVRATMASGIGDGAAFPADDLDAPKVEAPSIVPKVAPDDGEPLGEWDAGGDTDDKPIPPREWLLGNTFCRGYVSSLLGGGAAGKSATRLAQMIACAT